MNVRHLGLLALSLSALSCSSEQTVTVSGGAYFELQPATGSTFGPCNDLGGKYLIAIRGEDGTPKLMVDGADDASVACKADSGRFDVRVSNRTGTLLAAGTHANNASNDAEVTVITSAGSVYKTQGKKCKIAFIPQSESGKMRGEITCEELVNTRTNSACGISATGANKSYFAFANCTTF